MQKQIIKNIEKIVIRKNIIKKLTLLELIIKKLQKLVET